MPSTAWCPKSSALFCPHAIDDMLGTQVETLATVVNGMNTLLMLPYDYVMILGFGPIGYLFAQFARNIAAKVAVTEIDPFRISVAKECGLTVWDPNEEDVVQKITDFTYGRKADIVIEATGNALEQALQCVTPGGKVLPFGMDSSIQATIVPNEITRWATKILGLVPRSEYHGAFHPHLPGETSQHGTFLHQGHPVRRRPGCVRPARAGYEDPPAQTQERDEDRDEDVNATTRNHCIRSSDHDPLMPNMLIYQDATTIILAHARWKGNR